MGLSFLGVANSAADSLSASKTISGVGFGPEAANRHIIYAFAAEEEAAGDFGIVSATIGGVGAAVVVSQQDASTGSDTYMIMAAVPTATSGAIVVNFAGNHWSMHGGVYRATGLVSATPHHTASDTGDPISFAIDVPGGGCVVACAAQATEGTAFATSGVNERYDANWDFLRSGGGDISGLAAETGRAITFDGAGAGSGCCASWEIRESLLVAPPLQTFLAR